MKPLPPLIAGVAAALVKPGTVHTTAAACSEGVAADDKFNNSTPWESIKVDDTVTVDGFRLEHDAGTAAFELKAEKRSPAIEISLIGNALRAGFTKKDTDIITLLEFAL